MYVSSLEALRQEKHFDRSTCDAIRFLCCNCSFRPTRIVMMISFFVFLLISRFHSSITATIASTAPDDHIRPINPIISARIAKKRSRDNRTRSHLIRWPPSAAGFHFPLRRSRRRDAADHVEARLLLVGQRVVEIRQLRLYCVDRVGQGVEAFGHRIEPARQ